MSRLTPFSISSIESKMPIAFLRESTPYIPRLNRIVPKTRKWRRPGIRNSISFFARDDDRTDQRDGEQQRGDFEWQHVARHHQAADAFGSRNVQQAGAYFP